MKARLDRLGELLARADRPGGLYPALTLARAEGEAALPVIDRHARALAPHRPRRSDRSPHAVLLRRWVDSGATAGDLALALADAEPSLAFAHLSALDLCARGEDPRAVPFAVACAALRAVARKRAARYEALLTELTRRFDSISERDATARGVAFNVAQAEPLFVRPDERACFARACLFHDRGALGQSGLGDAIDPAELLEARMLHDADGAHSSAPLAALASLEARAMLVRLDASGPSLRKAARAGAFAEMTGLRDLAISRASLRADAAEIAAIGDALSRCPIASIKLELDTDREPLVPAWLERLSGLTSLTLWCSGNKEVEVPESLGRLPRLRHLSISGDRVVSLPDAIGALTELRTLRLASWRLARLPAGLGRLGKLEELTSYASLALGPLPDELSGLVSLRRLHLGHLDTPDVPAVLFEMPWLTSLTVTSARRWSEARVEALRAAFPDEAFVSVSFTGNARGTST
jgi:hypothetical protein